MTFRNPSTTAFGGGPPPLSGEAFFVLSKVCAESKKAPLKGELAPEGRLRGLLLIANLLK
ncbi:MAG: hypothetical protein LUH56_05405 [Oscillospiraceae bacterium]|nr:hypothetical protein [Oscillospiraceae bacterium]